MRKKHQTANLYKETHDVLEELLKTWNVTHKDKDGFTPVGIPSKALIIHSLVVSEMKRVISMKEKGEI